MICLDKVRRDLWLHTVIHVDRQCYINSHKNFDMLEFCT